MTVSLTEFLSTGNLGDLREGMSKEEVQGLLGTPDDTGGTSRKYRQPSCFLYGTVEIWFRQQQPRELVSLSWQAGGKGVFYGKGVFRLTPTCTVTDWAFAPDWTVEQVENYLGERNLPFEYRDAMSSKSPPLMILPSGVSISFDEDGNLWGLHMTARLG